VEKTTRTVCKHHLVSPIEEEATSASFRLERNTLVRIRVSDGTYSHPLADIFCAIAMMVGFIALVCIVVQWCGKIVLARMGYFWQHQ
jgi:hypothetical protein